MTAKTYRKIGERIREAREAAKLSQDELGAMLNKTGATISNYESGNARIHIEVLEQIADITDRPLTWFLGEDNESVKRHRLLKAMEQGLEVLKGGKQIGIPLSEFKRVPIVGRVHAGELMEAIEHPEAWMPLPPGIDADLALLVVGDSMEPNLSDGDYVCVKLQPEAENGKSIVARIDGEVAVKRFYKYNDTIVLRSDNKKYPDIISRDVEVLGIVRCKISKEV